MGNCIVNIYRNATCMLFNFVLVWLYNYFDPGVTGESYVDKTRVSRIKL